MKKFSVLILVLFLIAGTACAKQIEKLPPVSFDDINNGEFDARIAISDVGENTVKVTLCAEERYSAKDVDSLQPGDTVAWCDDVITVRSIEVDEFGAFVNGDPMGSDGIQFFPLGDGMYCILEYESADYEEVQTVEYPYADEVTFSHWNHKAISGGADDMISVTVPAAEIRGVLNAYAEELYGLECLYPEETCIEVEDGKLTAITVYYTP